MTSAAFSEPFGPVPESLMDPPAPGSGGPPPARPVLTLVPDDLDDAQLTLEDLGSRIVGLSGRLAAATCQWLLMIARFDREDGAAKFGIHSTAAWLSHHCGMSHRTALDHVRVARTLHDHAPLAAEMSAGRLSYSHVRAISRVAGPEESALVEDLVAVAEHGTVGQLEDMVRSLKTVEMHEAREAAARGGGPPPEESEYVDTRWADDCRWRCSVRLLPERGAVVDAAVEAIGRAEHLDRPDALVRLAEIGLAALAEGGRMPRELRGDELAAVVIHIDARNVPPIPLPTTALPVDAVTDDAGTACRTAPPETGSGTAGAATPAAGGALDGRDRSRTAVRPPAVRPFARLVGGPGLSDAVALRLICDGGLRTVVYETDPDGRRRVLDVGRRRRLVTRKQYRAIVARDGDHCAVPACGSRRRLHVHHVRHWLFGGVSDPDNECLLCEVHHRKVHDEELLVEAVAPGRFRFRLPDGRALLDAVDPSALMPTDRPLDADHAGVPLDAATTRWDGTRLDRHYAVACLATRRTAARQARATPPAAGPTDDPTRHSTTDAVTDPTTALGTAGPRRGREQ